MHVLVTGGAGFIGSHLVDYHLSRGDRVHVIDDLSTGTLANISAHEANPDFQFDREDLISHRGLNEVASWADRIYHMAAVVGVKRVLEDPVEVMRTNVAGTERVLRAAQRSGWNPQVLVASSSEVYGFNPDPTFSETTPLVFSAAARLRWAYAVTKLADEYLAFAYHRGHGLPVVVARLFNTVGPRQLGRYGMVVPTFVRQAVTGEPITVYGNGAQSRCFCDVRDTAMMLNLLVANPAAAGEVINVGGDHEVTIQSLAELVVERTGSASPIRHIPYREAYGEEFEDIQHRRPELEKLHKLTEYQLQWSLERTLDDLIDRKRRTLEQQRA